MEGRYRCTKETHMMALVDTSVWIDFFKGYESPEAQALAG